MRIMKRRYWLIPAIVLALLAIGFLGYNLITTAGYRKNAKATADWLNVSLASGNLRAMGHQLRKLPPGEVDKAMSIFEANLTHFANVDPEALQPRIKRDGGRIFALFDYPNGVEIHYVSEDNGQFWTIVKVVGPER